ncbi:MAG: glycosyltransferase [Candidatus Methanomethylicaceae archaeon]
MRPRIAVLFPVFMGGGAEAVCAWILEALKNDYDVTLVTFSQETLIEALNRSYGTSLTPEKIKVLTIPMSFPFGKQILYSHSAYSFRQFFLMHYYKEKLSGNYDLAISAFNEMDLGKPGIQYVYLPMFGKGSEKLKKIVEHPDSLIRRLYKEFLRWWSGYSELRMRTNVTITLSNWMASQIRSLWGIESIVIYPPVLMDFVSVPWEDREDGFVLVARVVPEKRIEVAISILSEVRKRGHDVHLHILSGVRDAEYFSKLKKMTHDYDWVFWEQRLPRKEYTRMLSIHKYGIHPRKNEQFGIGVAEMVSAGVIPFVPSEGGQREIVGEEPLLIWDTEEEAVIKILEVLSQKKLQQELQRRLQTNVDRWSVSRFKNDIQYMVESFFVREGDRFI